MKKVILNSLAAILMFAAFPAFSQMYKTAQDTVALNAEYAKVNSNILVLNVSLDKAKSAQAEAVKRAADATSDAQNTANKASDKASQSTGSSVSDAKKAKREAKRAVKDAKDSRRAQSNLDDQNKKVDKLTSDLQKKQNRLNSLDAMRSAIAALPQQ